MRRIMTITIVALCLAMCTSLAVGADYINHFGQSNPTSEGWIFSGGTTVGGGSESGYDYWGLNDLNAGSPQEIYYDYTPSAAQYQNDWRITNIVKVVSGEGNQAGVTQSLLDGTSHIYTMWDPNGWHYKNSSNEWSLISYASTSSYHQYDLIADLVSSGSHNSSDQFTFYIDSEPVKTVNRSDLRSLPGMSPKLEWGDVSDVTRSSSRWNEVTFTGDLTISDPPPPQTYPLSRGHRILIEKGLQILAMTTPYGSYNSTPDAAYWATMDAGGFTTAYMNIGAGIENLPTIPDGRQWSLHAQGDWTVPAALVPNLVSIQYRDEQDVGNSTTLQEAAGQLAIYRANYPDAISYTNQWGGQISTAAMRTYMSTAKPDMLSFDWYPWEWGKTQMYQYMQEYRMLALSGNDGSGNTPIPYGRYVQSWRSVGGHMPTQSEINLDHFASWAFGYTLTNAFTYDRAQMDPPMDPILFPGGGTGPSDYSNPTRRYDFFAEANAEGQKLGPTLVRLLSTDVRIVEGETSSKPSNVNLWTPSAGHNSWYMTDISANNLGSTNGGSDGDLIVGYFKPLLESFDGDEYEDETYFMIVNGLTAPLNGGGEECRQEITIDFDFGGSGIDSLQRLNRTTGEVDILDLIFLSGTEYRYIFELDGGKGDLFKYNTGAPFIVSGSIPPPTPTGDFDQDGDVDGVDFYPWQAGYPTASGATLSTGDADGDGDVDGVDFGIWQANYPTNVGGSAAVPEPATLLLTMLAGLTLVVIRRRRIG